MTHLNIGSIRTTPGNRDAVIAILLEGQDGLREVGCSQYLIGADDSDPDLIWVSEVWDSKESHDGSLKLPAVREAIGRAMPMLTGEFTGGGSTLVGGLGAPTG